MRRITLVVWLVALPALGCEPGDASCEDARNDIQQQIASVCKEEAFVHTPFCSTCLPDYYSIDDSCTCRVLNFDADFCYYAPGATEEGDANRIGTPRIRAAVLHAAEVCKDRAALRPDAHDTATDAAQDAASDASPDVEVGTGEAATADATDGGGA